MNYNNEFIFYYNKIDEECRQQFGIFDRGKNAIYYWSKNLSEYDADKVRNLIQIRNLIVHQNNISIGADLVDSIKHYWDLLINNPNQTQQDNYIHDDMEKLLPKGTFRKITLR